jgi:hypothetical protein
MFIFEHNNSMMNQLFSLKVDALGITCTYFPLLYRFFLLTLFDCHHCFQEKTRIKSQKKESQQMTDKKIYATRSPFAILFYNDAIDCSEVGARWVPV